MAHKLCMIPGPIEVDQAVLSAMSTPATSHVAPNFISSFSKAIKLLRQAFLAPTAQPFVVAGSGTLTWDMTAANLIEKGDNVLVVNTGVFGDWFGECLTVYGGNVTHVRAEFGDVPSLSAIEVALKNDKFKMITLTQVDTSTSALVDVKSIAAMVKRVSPDTLIAIDGVCSIAGEELRHDEWGIDVSMTASQKALGVPPGLAVMVVSQRALQVAKDRKSPPSTYFGSFQKWLPIMQKYESLQPSYFATPPVQLIFSLEQSLLQYADKMDERFQKHREISTKVKDFLEAKGLKIVPVSRDKAANTLTAVYYPKGVTGAEFLPKVTNRGIVIAGGLHPRFAAEYFRIGHMGMSATHDSLGHIETTLNGIWEALTECGYKGKL